ncbi:colibactin hybrid non-ribosomal peptide synthetase/type I polyketide synthase ClbB, partial [Klebsiella pneumoniae]|nr:colibactin hybrid non-ribosomal peptide synthetase/type I polyketide synthase ClbB [Klebsiella pneumoniae]
MDNTSGDFPCNKMDTRKQLPLTPSQQGFLFHSLKDKKRSNYHEHFTCIFSQHVDSAHFKWALETLFRKHECFRTDYNWEIDERPCQVVKTDVLPDIYVLDCEQEEIRFLLANDDIIIPVPQDDGIDAIIPQLLQADLKYPFSLKTIPVRAYLIQSTKESAFILSYHHIVMDGWSLSLFIKQLLQLYGAAVVSGVRDDSAIIPSSLKPLVDTLSARRHTFQHDYWAAYLREGTPTCIVPLSQYHTDTEAENNSYVNQTNHVEINLSPDVCQKIQTLCSDYRITPAVIFYVAWGILLQRWCYADDVLFGATISGRNIPIDGIEETLGLFINTLPLRLRDDGATLLQHLQRMHQTLIAHYSNEHDALASIQRLVHKEGHAGDLFNTLVVLENYPVDMTLLSCASPVAIRHLSVHEQTHYPLTLTITQQKGFRFSIAYALNYLTNNMAQALLMHLSYLLEQLVDNPQRPIAALVNLSPCQQAQVLQPYLERMACRDWDSQSNVIEQFHQVAATSPAQVAVVDELCALTYSELAAQAEQLAAYLVQQGVMVGDTVGIISERRVNTVVAIIAIMLIGAAYVPISPDYPVGRMQEIIDDSGLALLLVHGKPLDALNVAQSDLCAFPVAPSVVFPVITPDSRAYVIYSSGSTGKPKGIAVAHRGLLRLIQGDSPLKVESGETTLLTCPFEFDVSVFEMWSTLLNHGKLVLLSKQALLDINHIRRTIADEQVARAWFTSSLFNSYVAEGADFFGMLQHITVGGEAVSAWHVNDVMQKYPHLVVTNGYGPTENTIFTTAYRFNGLQPARVPIGYAVPGTSLYITDLHGHLLPIGATGELVAGGVGVAIGYQNNPALSATVFVPDPFIPGGMMYKTGDYARLLDDGCVDCFGRKDGQIKINGQRIETGEIEQRLLECSGIIEAVVVPYRVRETLHIAAVVCVNDSYDEVEVRGQLADRLPPFAIPESLVVVTEIAKSHSGKADLAQLRYLLPATQCNAVSTTISEVHSDMEHALHAIWQRVLDRQDIDSNASFFALGGTSLDTIRVKGDIKRQLGLEIDITDLFKYPTLT